jgi:D-alanine-D-alanine ligase
MNMEVDPDWWKTLFDDVYLLTDARSVCDVSLTRKEVDLILDILPMESYHRVLDLCGGQGRHSFELQSRGVAGCTLADYSESLTGCARVYASREHRIMEIVRCDARCTGLAPESFDHVLVMGNSLGYIQQPHADREIVSEAFRVLRPGGWLLVDVTDGTVIKKNFIDRSWHEIEDDVVVCRYRELLDHAIHAREMVLSKKDGLIRDRTYGVRLFSARTLSDLVSGAGFGEVTVRTDFSPHQSGEDRGFMNHRMIATAKKP